MKHPIYNPCIHERESLLKGALRMFPPLVFLRDACVKTDDFSEVSHRRRKRANNRRKSESAAECFPMGARCRLSLTFPASNIQQAASTLQIKPSRLQSCSQAFNKQRKWHITPSPLSEKVALERKRKPSPVI